MCVYIYAENLWAEGRKLIGRGPRTWTEDPDNTVMLNQKTNLDHVEPDFRAIHLSICNRGQLCISRYLVQHDSDFVLFVQHECFFGAT